MLFYSLFAGNPPLPAIIYIQSGVQYETML